MTYTYVCSDLHGMFEKYIALVNTLKNSDQLYIIGDVIDRGNDGIKILQDIITRDNVHMTLGNHEFLLREDLVQLAGCEKMDMYITGVKLNIMHYLVYYTDLSNREYSSMEPIGIFDEKEKARKVA